MRRPFGYNNLRKRAFCVTVALSLLFCSGLAFAQGPAPNGYQIGFPEHGDFSGTDFENVQINNGNLHIEIPLWSTAGRGSSVGFKYVYDSLGWGFKEKCSRTGDTCTDTYTPNPPGSNIVTNHLRFTLVGPQSYMLKNATQTVTCPGGVQVINHSYSLAAPDGTHHHFRPDPTNTGSQTGFCSPHPNNAYADDGSGWMVQLDPSTGGIIKAVAKDGTFLGTAIEDTNGNEVITPPPGTTLKGTDTLGRQFNTDGSYFDSNSVLRALSITYTSVNIQTDFCGIPNPPTSGCIEYSATWSVPQTVTLPNGMTYTFTWGANQCGSTSPYIYYGQPCSVTLPTGGTITWGWNGQGFTGPALVSRQLSGDPGPFSYGGASGIGPKVTDPAGNDTVYTCGNYAPVGSDPSDSSCYVIKKQSYQGSYTSGTLLKTIQTDYWQTNGSCAIACLPIHETTTWNQQNLVSRTETDYDSYPGWTWANTTYYVTPGNPIEKREFGYGTGTWGAQIRTTDYGYLHLSNSTYLNANILDRVTSTKVYAGSSQSGTLVAQTQNTYDGVAIAGNTSANQAPNHDYTNFPASYNVRGNLTQASRGLKTGSTWTWLSANKTYNDLGEILTSKDPLNNQTTYDYTDAWASISNPQCVTSAHSYGFPTTITDALGHRTKHSYFSCTSLLGSTQDENDIAASRLGTTYTYDLMDRMLTENLPDGGQTTVSYNDAVPYSKTSTELVATSPSTLNKVNTTVFDGLGRVQQTQLVDPDCSGGTGLVKVDHSYGYNSGAGKFTKVSTPYCNSPDSTYGLMATTNYDALDRVTSVVQTDSSTVTTTYSGTTAGLTSTVTDEAGKKRTNQTDALGRLTAVWEDPSNLDYETDYVYDTLDNLTSVTQKGGVSSSSWRNRSFTYDSLSRLTCAANPEVTPGLSTVNAASCPASYTGAYTNGTIGYVYDADGNLITKTAPAPNQTSTTSTVATNYSYDVLNRLTQVSYTGGPSTPTVKYGYDGVALTGCTTTPPTLSPADANPVDYRSSMCDGSGATSWSHDAMGRTLTEQRIINGTSAINNSVKYAYFKDGEINTLTYPSGRLVTYSLTSGGSCNGGTCTSARPLSAVDSITNYVTAASYAPHGAIAGLKYGALISGGFTYNSRLQPLQMAYGTGTLPTLTGTTCPTPATIMHRLYDFHLGSGDNGNVQVINNCKDTNRTQNFFYDNLNRITQAYTTGNSPLTTSWGETLTVDAWGNLTNKAPVTGKTNTETLNASPASVKNQLNSFCNDAAGNLVLNAVCPTGTFTPTYSYDAENRVTSAAAGYSYVYNGDGERVKKCSNSGCTTGTLYWRGMGSDPLTESNVGGTFTEDYIFFNGSRVARRDLPLGLHYYFSDHLGTADVIAGDTGAIQRDSDYYPYGGELVVSGSDINAYKFNAKERDSESGLDYFGARHYSSGLSRFMIPDWAAKPTDVPYANFGNPQSLNLFSFVQNNPTTLGDPDGHQCVQCVTWVEQAAEEVAESPAGQQAINWTAHVIAAAGALISTGMTAAGNGQFGNAYPSYYHPVDDPNPFFQSSNTASQPAQGQPAQSGESTPAQPPEGGLPKPPTGKGSVTPDQRDPKRVSTPAEKDQKLAEQGGKCANCNGGVKPGEGIGHHKKRWADGGKTNSRNVPIVCKECHKELHSKTRPVNAPGQDPVAHHPPKN